MFWDWISFSDRQWDPISWQGTFKMNILKPGNVYASLNWVSCGSHNDLLLVQRCQGINLLTHWGRVTHICVSTQTIIGSDNGLLPGWRQAIIWTNAGILLIGPLGTNFGEMLIKIHIFLSRKSIWNVIWKKVAILSRPQCLRFWCIMNWALRNKC